ncbi:hypothetical protein PP655_gp114 [Bacillus phage PBC4]|uniref:Uncharacterized protein n=1 Tax=Bacillus phage PBC4 TaxID=1675028 RepID=A0A1D6X8G3_9CAUD|nr:hypothetical protein PP655_gp114 [Bacillus phage PBC4]AKQ08306.1 hypothetical protein PBC4_114 [Bacillus phage PBC4]
MFGRKALKEEVLFYKQRAERIEIEKWDMQRGISQLERDKKSLEKSLNAHKDTIFKLKKEKKQLEDELNAEKEFRKHLQEQLNEKQTKDELIAQLAELLLDENRGTEKESLIQQMHGALRINNNQHVPQGAEPQWLNPQQ